MIGNAVRISLVVYLADNVNESFASGATHELLGLANFVFVFLFALSTDRGVNAWYASVPDMTQAALESDEFEEPVVDGVVVPRPTAFQHTVNRPAIWQWSLAISFVLIGLFSSRLIYAKSIIDNFRFDETALATSYKTDLPEQIGGWKFSAFAHQERDDTRLLAPESYVWTFVKGDQRVTISLDSPYLDFHNLSDCYEGYGWDIDYENRYLDLDNDLSKATNLTELKMEKSGEHGVVMFTAFDRDGILVRPTFDLNYDPTRGMEIMRHVRMVFGLLTQENDPKFSKQTLPISQVQLMHIDNQEILDTTDIEQLFIEVRARLQASARFGN